MPKSSVESLVSFVNFIYNFPSRPFKTFMGEDAIISYIKDYAYNQSSIIPESLFDSILEQQDEATRKALREIWAAANSFRDNVSILYDCRVISPADWPSYLKKLKDLKTSQQHCIHILIFPLDTSQDKRSVFLVYLVNPEDNKYDIKYIGAGYGYEKDHKYYEKDYHLYPDTVSYSVDHFNEIISIIRQQLQCSDF
ncbi:MAG: hypothetical protein QXJ06_04555 [Candidatus Aenigmatarchaeota archaeon]